MLGNEINQTVNIPLGHFVIEAFAQNLMNAPKLAHQSHVFRSEKVTIKIKLPNSSRVRMNKSWLVSLVSDQT